MKKFVYPFILVFIISFFACQKMVDWKVDPITKDVIGDSSRYNTQSSGVLTAIVAITGNESLTTSFTYDSLNRLIAEHRTGQQNGKVVNDYKKFYRDTLGRIVRVAEISASVSTTTDTLFTDVWYDEDEPQFLRTVGTIVNNGAKLYDSTVYTYDGNGHIGIRKSYQKLQGAISDATLQQRQEFAYQNNNLTSFKSYRDSSGVLVLTENCRYQYDQRVNPLYLNNNAFLTGRIESASQNNVVKLEMANPLSGQFTTQITNALVYGGRSKPLSGSATSNGSVSMLTFVYK